MDKIIKKSDVFIVSSLKFFLFEKYSKSILNLKKRNRKKRVFYTSISDKVSKSAEKKSAMSFFQKKKQKILFSLE